MPRTFENLSQHELGFFEVTDKPSENELQAYYASKYYQEGRGSYELSYSEAELSYFRAKLEQRWHALRNRFPAPGSFLDVGCGEGYALAYFAELGWSVKGFDFSRAGVLAKNPAHADRLVDGNIFESLERELAGDHKYDVIWLQNVLEHVLQPVQLMHSLRKLVSTNGALVVSVPNDFSEVQLRALDHGKIANPFWIALPDHLSYFSRDSLERLGEATGWHCVDVLADFPIDWFLYHPGSNYVQDRSVGKAAHRARVELEVLIAEQPLPAVTAFFSAMARIGMGRDLTAYFVCS